MKRATTTLLAILVSASAAGTAPRVGMLKPVAGHGASQAELAAGDNLLAHSPTLQPLIAVAAYLVADVLDHRVRVESRLNVPPLRSPQGHPGLD